MKSYINPAFFFILLLFFAGCEGEKKDNPQEIIAGEDSKTWISSKEVNPGEEEKIKRTEEPQEFRFSADGTFQLRSGEVVHTGTWTYERGNRELQLIFDRKPGLIEIFYVTRLEEDQLDLRAPDGGTMQLQALKVES